MRRVRTGLFTSPLALSFDLPQPSFIIRNITTRVAHLAHCTYLKSDRRYKGRREEKDQFRQISMLHIRCIFSIMTSYETECYF